MLHVERGVVLKGSCVILFIGIKLSLGLARKWSPVCVPIERRCVCVCVEVEILIGCVMTTVSTMCVRWAIGDGSRGACVMWVSLTC